jgi:hypothetical protein
MRTIPHGLAPALGNAVTSTQQTKNNINTESLKDDKQEEVNVVNFLREPGII